MIRLCSITSAPVPGFSYTQRYDHYTDSGGVWTADHNFAHCSSLWC